MPYPIELWLVDPREEACAAFRDRFAGLPDVHVMQTRFETLDRHDCFITAGNGLGLMAAGIACRAPSEPSIVFAVILFAQLRDDG